MQYQYTIHHKEKVYDGFFKFNRYLVSFEKFNGGFIDNAIRECGRKADVVAVLPYDPLRNEFLLVEQFRIGMAARNLHPWTAEIVAGFMDIPGESPKQTAQRELLEETGCQAKTLHHLMSFYPSPGGSASRNHLFIATIDSNQAKAVTGLTEEGEDIRVHRIGVKQIKAQIDKGEINSATSLIAFQQFFLNQWQTRLQASQS